MSWVESWWAEWRVVASNPSTILSVFWLVLEYFLAVLSCVFGKPWEISVLSSTRSTYSAPSCGVMKITNQEDLSVCVCLRVGSALCKWFITVGYQVSLSHGLQCLSILHTALISSFHYLPWEIRTTEGHCSFDITQQPFFRFYTKFKGVQNMLQSCTALLSTKQIQWTLHYPHYPKINDIHGIFAGYYFFHWKSIISLIWYLESWFSQRVKFGQRGPDNGGSTVVHVLLGMWQ